MRLGTERGRQTRADLKVGICGEHGGDPSSVEFCHQVGLNYVSCSPFRVPIARLAAQAASPPGSVTASSGLASCYLLATWGARPWGSPHPPFSPPLGPPPPPPPPPSPPAREPRARAQGGFLIILRRAGSRGGALPSPRTPGSPLAAPSPIWSHLKGVRLPLGGEGQGGAGRDVLELLGGGTTAVRAPGAYAHGGQLRPRVARQTSRTMADPTIDEIKQRIDIVDPISARWRSAEGRAHVGAVPLPPGEDALLQRRSRPRTYHCFGCSKSGDVFSWVQETEGLDFGEALRKLADRAGVRLPERAGRPPDPQAQAAADALSEASAWFHNLLLRAPEGAQARQYLGRRGVRLETVERFALGWAPERWDGLTATSSAGG